MKKTKYTTRDFRKIALELVRTYNRTNPIIKATMTAGYYIEVSDNHTRLVLNHPELICEVL